MAFCARTSLLSASTPPGSAYRPAACTRRGNTVVVRVFANDEVPANVAEAREWIAAWRAKQKAPARPAASSNGATPHAPTQPEPAAAAARAKKQKKKSKLGATKSFADGTLVFTADQLQKVSYNDVKLKH